MLISLYSIINLFIRHDTLKVFLTKHYNNARLALIVVKFKTFTVVDFKIVGHLLNDIYYL